ncbi:hypothetical protein [Kibdelosporangium philippinense]|uniref:hypothetical protein n=1 Tax=Kibdelosporangium philippinense TaxID=211113 RepID=UPI003610FAFC
MTADEGGRDSGPPPDEVTAFYYPSTRLALDYYEAIPYRDTLWVLTPQRLHVAQRLQPPEPVDEFPDGPPRLSAKELARHQPQGHRTTGPVATQAAAVPAEAVCRHSSCAHRQVFPWTVTVAIRKRHFLRMELTDGSGFEFFFGLRHPRAHYDQLLALTLGGS